MEGEGSKLEISMMEKANFKETTEECPALTVVLDTFERCLLFQRLLPRKNTAGETSVVSYLLCLVYATVLPAELFLAFSDRCPLADVSMLAKPPGADIALQTEGGSWWLYFCHFGW